MNKLYRDYIKRVLDILLAVFALVLLSWLFAIIAVAIKMSGGESVIFKQKRTGRNMTDFYIYKFETMSKDTPSELATSKMMKDNVHYTPMGEFLRKTSLNELPQLFNILKGDMAIIGPRPSLWNQFDLIELREKHDVHSVRPGLTGWAQVNGRDLLTDDQKVEFDTEYVEKLSFIFDLKCFIKTIGVVTSFFGVVDAQASESSIDINTNTFESFETAHKRQNFIDTTNVIEKVRIVDDTLYIFNDEMTGNAQTDVFLIKEANDFATKSATPEKIHR